MAIKTVKVGLLRALHKHLSAVLDEVDGKVPAEDIDLTSAERGGQKPTVDSAPRVPMNTGIPGFDRISKHRS
jgi:hypothetical protein